MCNDVPEDKCDRVPVAVTNYVEDQPKCSYVHDRKCVNTTKQECVDKEVNIPKQIEVMECIIDYIKDCKY